MALQARGFCHGKHCIERVPQVWALGSRSVGLESGEKLLAVGNFLVSAVAMMEEEFV
jgi:hypothetical protein